jgi:hypothetical protein
MALVTITAFYGQDSVAGSRTVIVNNFNILGSAVNALATFLDPNLQTLSGVVGVNIILPTSSSPVTTVTFSNAGSSSIAGNLSVGQAISSSSVNVAAGGITVTGGNVSLNTNTAVLATAGDLLVGQREKITGEFLLTQLVWAAIPSGGFDVTNSRVVMISSTGNLTLTTAQDGQRVTFYNVGSGTTTFQTTNFTNLITAPIVLSSKGQILDLWWKDSAWHVLGTQGGVTVTYA